MLQISFTFQKLLSDIDQLFHYDFAKIRHIFLVHQRIFVCPETPSSILYWEANGRLGWIDVQKQLILTEKTNYWLVECRSEEDLKNKLKTIKKNRIFRQKCLKRHKNLLPWPKKALPKQMIEPGKSGVALPNENILCIYSRNED